MPQTQKMLHEENLTEVVQGITRLFLKRSHPSNIAQGSINYKLRSFNIALKFFIETLKLAYVLHKWLVFTFSLIFLFLYLYYVTTSLPILTLFLITYVVLVKIAPEFGFPCKFYLLFYFSQNRKDTRHLTILFQVNHLFPWLTLPISFDASLADLSTS